MDEDVEVDETPIDTAAGALSILIGRRRELIGQIATGVIEKETLKNLVLVQQAIDVVDHSLDEETGMLEDDSADVDEEDLPPT